MHKPANNSIKNSWYKMYYTIFAAMRILLIFLLPFVAFNSFSQTNPVSKSFDLKITTETAESKKLYLLYNIAQKQVIDSATAINGVFSFKGAINSLDLATLVLDQQGTGLHKIMQRPPYEADMINVFLHAGSISMITPDSIKKATFTISDINKDNMKLQGLLKPTSDAALNVVNLAKQEQDPAQSEKLRQQYDSIAAISKETLKGFARKNPKSFISLLALQDYAGANPSNVNEIRTIYNSLNVSVKNTKEGKDYAKFLEDRAKLSIGVMAPEFSQLDTAGKLVRLSSFRGKFLLVDFWASWCGPCRQDNPNLVNVYQKYKDKNFTILGVSLDRPEGKNAWLKAIKNDKLEWTQVSDLKFWKNDVAVLYGVQAIPQNFLIDPKGKIVAKNLRGKDLEKKLEELLTGSD